MTDDELIARGSRVLALERDALEEARMRLGAPFAAAVRLLAVAKGRVIVAGIGKSGLIGRKIAATMTSTGTPATFLHPTESVHGDLGIIGSDDVAILLSKSGETTELFPLLEALQREGVGVIAITGSATSTLGRYADVVLDGWVREEACPHDLAPTTSTTVALALGDALAVALLEVKGFQREDFARLHPGGSLGRRLMTSVADVMVPVAGATVPRTATMREAILVPSRARGGHGTQRGDGGCHNDGRPHTTAPGRRRRHDHGGGRGDDAGAASRADERVGQRRRTPHGTTRDHRNASPHA